MDNITLVKLTYLPQSLTPDIKDDVFVNIFVDLLGEYFWYIDLWIVDCTENGIPPPDPVGKTAVVQFHVGIAKFDRLPGGQSTLESAGALTEKDQQGVFVRWQVRIALYLTRGDIHRSPDSKILEFYRAQGVG